jgi:excisionase family DNA binding protein
MPPVDLVEKLPEKRAYRVNEFCHRYGLSRSYAYVLAKQGKLRLVKVGHRTLITHEDAEALLNESAI